MTLRKGPGGVKGLSYQALATAIRFSLLAPVSLSNSNILLSLKVNPLCITSDLALTSILSDYRWTVLSTGLKAPKMH